MVVIGQGGYVRASWLYSGKSACIWVKVDVFEHSVVFEKSPCIRQTGCIWARWLSCRQSGCIRAKLVVFGKNWLYSGKVVLFLQKWFYSCKGGCIRTKVLVIEQKWLY